MLAIRQLVVTALVGHVFIVLAAMPAHAFEKASDLFDLIEFSRNFPDDKSGDLAFLAFVSGFRDGYRVGMADTDQVLRHCIPAGTSKGDIHQAVRRFVEYGAVYGSGSLSPQEFLDTEIIVTITAALAVNYPCRE